MTKRTIKTKFVGLSGFCISISLASQSIPTLYAYQVGVSELACETLGMGCPIHELSVQVSCGLGQDDFPEISKHISSKIGFSDCPPSMKEALTKGVRLPDEKSCNNELISDFVDQTLSHDKVKHLHPLRITHQHIHGSPLTLVRNKLVSYTSNLQWRNQMLLQSSVWYCQTIASPNEETAYTKLGLIFHTLGDTYSESHVQRAVPKDIDSMNPCGSQNKMPIKRGYSMDYASWIKHIPPDADVDNVRFQCLLSQMADLLIQAKEARQSYADSPTEIEKKDSADQSMESFISYLCHHSWFMDSEDLAKASGGISEKLSATGRSEVPTAIAGIKEFQKHLTDNKGFNWYASGQIDLCQILTNWDKSPDESMKCSEKELKEINSTGDHPVWSYLEFPALNNRLDWTDGAGFDVVLPERQP